MIGNAKRVILVADSGKFGRIAFAKVADFGAVHTLVTDKAPPCPVVESLAQANVTVLVAEGERLHRSAL